MLYSMYSMKNDLRIVMSNIEREAVLKISSKSDLFQPFDKFKVAGPYWKIPFKRDKNLLSVLSI